MKTEIPTGRRKIVRGEHLYLGQTHKGGHRWMSTLHPLAGAAVVCCSSCGRLKQGETMPESWAPILR